MSLTVVDFWNSQTKKTSELAWAEARNSQYLRNESFLIFSLYSLTWEVVGGSSPLIKGLSTAKSCKCQIPANYGKTGFPSSHHYDLSLPLCLPLGNKLEIREMRRIFFWSCDLPISFLHCFGLAWTNQRPELSSIKEWMWFFMTEWEHDWDGDASKKKYRELQSYLLMNFIVKSTMWTATYGSKF